MELRDELFDSLILDNTYIKLEDLDEAGSYISMNRRDSNEVIVDEKIIEEVISKICHIPKNTVEKDEISSLKELEEDMRDVDFFRSHLKDEIKLYLEAKVDNKFNRYHILKLGLFLHDAGKPGSKTTDSTGRVHFKGHEVIGEKIGEEIATNLNLSLMAKELLCKYIRNHMILLVLYKTDDMSKERLFKIFDELGDDTIGIMLLGYADIVATRKLLNPNEDMGVIKTYMEYVLTNYIYKYKQN